MALKKSRWNGKKGETPHIVFGSDGREDRIIDILLAKDPEDAFKRAEFGYSYYEKVYVAPIPNTYYAKDQYLLGYPIAWEDGIAHITVPAKAIAGRAWEVVQGIGDNYEAPATIVIDFTKYTGDFVELIKEARQEATEDITFKYLAKGKSLPKLKRALLIAGLE